MGIVYNSKVGSGYISAPSCPQKASRRRIVRGLTRQNIQFLKSLGLNVVVGIAGRTKRKNIKSLTN